MKAIAGMEHLNKNLLCAIAIETTGNRLNYHDVCQICILPVNYNLYPVRVIPFFCDISPRHLHRIDKDTMTLSREKMLMISEHGLDSWLAADLLEQWFDKLSLPKYKKIMPLSYNWAKIHSFLVHWLGQQTTEYIFDYRYRDVLPMSLYLNDYYNFKADAYPFAKNNFTYLCSSMRVDHEVRAHRDCMNDCHALINLYRASMSNIDIHERFEIVRREKEEQEE